jgi:hypothetical protein
MMIKMCIEGFAATVEPGWNRTLSLTVNINDPVKPSVKFPLINANTLTHKWKQEQQFNGD